jgi:hypothetical protein
LQLLKSNPFGGLVSLDLFLFVGNLFGILLYLALYVSLEQVNKSYALVALAVGLIAIDVAGPVPAAGGNAESQQAVCQCDQRSRQGAISGNRRHAPGNFQWHRLVHEHLAGRHFPACASSILMLRGRIYSKATAIVGIITNAVVCGFFIPGLGTFLLFLSLPGYMIWYFLLAKRFFQLGDRRQFAS